MEIDYSDIPEALLQKPQKWTPPRHVYFGPKDAEGSMLPEPVYSHIEFPRMMYAKFGDRLKATLAKDETDYQSMVAQGYKKFPGDFGVITAPSFDQYLALKKESEDKKLAAESESRIKAEAERESMEIGRATLIEAAAEKRGPGRPRINAGV